MTSLLSRTTIQSKIIAMAMATGLFALVASTVANFIYDLSKEASKLEDDLVILSEVIGDRSTAAIQFYDSDQAERNLLALSAQNNIRFACIYSLEGDVFAKTTFINNGQDTQCPEPIYKDIKYWSDYLEVYTPIRLDDEIIGLLFLSADLSNFYQERNLKLAVLILIALASLPVALILSRKFQTMITVPLEQLGNTMQQIIRRGNYAIRAAKESQDEVGILVDVFNTMLEKIEREHINLTDSEERFRTIAEVAPIGIIQANSAGIIVFSNDLWSTLSSDAENIDDWMDAIHTRERSSVRVAWQELKEQPQALSMEFRYKKADQYQWVLLQATSLRDRLGKHIGYMAALTDIHELKEAQLQLENLAFFDPLTNLANRRLFADRLEQCIATTSRHDEQVALLFLDLDQFKTINDTLGHDAGDLLLKTVAERLEYVVRETDVVARVGGDEFMVILSNIIHDHDIQVVANKILSSLAKPIHLGQQEILVTVSIGITVAPHDGNTSIDLMKNADLAMYQAKAKGRNNYQFFSKEMNSKLIEDTKIEADLRKSLKQSDDFILQYQPKVDILTGEFRGMEGLLRWKHPERGMVPPDSFIPNAEATGLILPIGQRVLEKAARDLDHFIQANLWPESAKLAINLSPRQFAHTDLIDDFKQLEQSYPHILPYLEVEITESMLMHDINRTIQTLNNIKELGIKVSIDDFGTGYSSLNYLKRFPIDILKVDRTFVMDIPQDPSDMAITAAVIAMAHKLNMEVVAEGVETQQQLDFLRENNCEYGQGYFFSPPVSVTEIRELLKRKKVFY